MNQLFQTVLVTIAPEAISVGASLPVIIIVLLFWSVLALSLRTLIAVYAIELQMLDTNHLHDKTKHLN